MKKPRRLDRPPRDAAGRTPDPALREIDEELRFHLEGRVRDLMRQGHAEDDARRMAQAAFGDLNQVRREMHDAERQRRQRQSRRDLLRDLGRDLRQGMRRLRRSPSYTAVAICTLALGIGASVAMFTVLDAVVLRPLPYTQSERLVQLFPQANQNIWLSRTLGAGTPSVESSTGLSRWALTLTGQGEATVLTVLAVDAGYFDVFDVRPALGRAFRPEDTDPAQSDVVLLSYGLWRSRFGGAEVLGRRIRLDGYLHETREIVGVMPEGFQPLGAPVDAWIPLHIPPGRDFAADSSWYVNSVVGRMTPGATLEQVTAELKGVVSDVAAANPGRMDAEQVASASAVSLLDAVVGDVRRTLWTLLGAVVLVLLIACANVANLLLSRAVGQRQDLAVRSALGANRFRLAREQLAESSLLAAAGGGLGALLAHASLIGLRVADASGLPRVAALHGGVDGRALAFALAASVGSVLLFGVFPAWRTARDAPHTGLHDSSRGGSRGRRSHSINRGLVVLEMALAMILVTGAGLMLASFAALRSVDAGLDARDVLSVRLAPSEGRYAGERARQLWQDLESRVAALPGVTGVGSIQLEPFTLGNWSFPYLAEGVPPAADGHLETANIRMVTPGYFSAVDMPVLSGRPLTAEDRQGAPRSLLINHAMAEELWPGEDPLGREIRIFGSLSYRIVGVVGDVHQHALDLEPLPEMYVPHAQWGPPPVSMVLMVEGPELSALTSAIRDIVRSLDPDIPIPSAQPLSELLDASMDRRRFFAGLLGAFGGIALLLGGLGVYGVMSHLVGTRLPDFGVRLALGAGPRDVQREALLSGLRPAALGLALGSVGAMATAQLLRAALYGVPPVHVPTFVGVGLVLGAVAVLATWMPARRAARVDPLSVIRVD
ncbi:MAG: ABC transporter permease [Gemmatimonadota bacterium]